MNNSTTKSNVKLYKNFKEVSIAEFFEKNRHLLGFDSPRKALLIAVKELVDNALDACEEHGILPDIKVILSEEKQGIYKLIVEDNGPGIPPDKIPKVFGSFLFGSKFHRYISTRGKQGIGAPAVVLYSQLTTGKPVKIISKTKNGDVYLFELKIDVKKNVPIILKKEKITNFKKEHGTRIEIYLRGAYHKGKQSVDEYIKLTFLANPHASIYYRNPKGEVFKYKRITTKIPILYEVKPHIHGIEIGVLERLIKETRYKTLKSFLMKTFSSIGEKTALFIIYKTFIDPECDDSKFDPKKLPKKKKKELEKYVNLDPKKLSFEDIERLYEVLQTVKVRAISSKYIVTLGEDLIREGLLKMFSPEFVSAKTRKPAIYRGNPFIVEVGIAYGGDIKESRLIRLANRVPLLYRAGECAITEAAKSINWKKYGLNSKEGELPSEPIIILVHIASVWIPFTSESKEAIASYPEIVKEIKLAIQDALRDLGIYIRKKETLNYLGKKYLYLYAYSNELAKALSKILNISETEILEKIQNRIKKELYNDLIEFINSVKDVKVLIEENKIEEAKELLKKMLSPILKAKILKESELYVIIENVLKNYRKN